MGVFVLVGPPKWAFLLVYLETPHKNGASNSKKRATPVSSETSELGFRFRPVSARLLNLRIWHHLGMLWLLAFGKSWEKTGPCVQESSPV